MQNEFCYLFAFTEALIYIPYIVIFLLCPQNSVIFTALHGMQTRSCDENSVCLSVRLSHACIVTKLKKDLSRFLYHQKDNLA